MLRARSPGLFFAKEQLEMTKIILISAIMFLALSLAAYGQAAYTIGMSTLDRVACCGLAEPTGDIAFTALEYTPPTVTGTITLRYNLPIANTEDAATGTNRVQVTATNGFGSLLTPQPAWVAINDGSNGLIVVGVPAGYTYPNVITVSNVRVNVSANCGSTSNAVTATAASTGNRLTIGETQDITLVKGVAQPLRTPLVAVTPGTLTKMSINASDGIVTGAATITTYENFLTAFGTVSTYPEPNRSQQTLIRLKVSAIPRGVTITFPQAAGIFETATSAGDSLGSAVVLTVNTLPQYVYYRMAAGSNPAALDSFSFSPTIATAGPFPLAPGTISISVAMAPITTGTTATLFPQYVEGCETDAVEFLEISNVFSRGIFAWGYNGTGQLGDGTTEERSSPVQVNNLSNAVTLAAKNNSMALKSDGTVWAWGNNNLGQLGNGTTTGSHTPVQAIDLFGVKAISAGGDFGLALKRDGTAWAWGDNSYGELGNSSITPYSTTPVQVIGFSDAVGIAGGYLYSLGLKSDGTVWRWGVNGYALFGCPDASATGFTFTPEQVSGLSSVKAIAAGYYHNLALKSDGTVWAWGCNYNGDLGNGTLNSSLTPVQATNLSGVVAISAGLMHSLALKNDGTVWAWGDNDWNQLGNSSGVSYSTTPVKVSGLYGVVAIAAGGLYNLAVKRDGTVWAWGDNGFGLGDGTTTNSSTPVQVGGLSHAVAIAAGYHHSLVYATTSRPFFDTDKDASSDISVYQPGTGFWYTLPSSAPGTYTVAQWGQSGDVPVPGDYDGDREFDIAVWHPSTGVWYILPSSAPGTYTGYAWGLPSDIPVQGDYDGDGKDDIAVWRPDDGIWYVLPSGSPGTFTSTQWGLNTDIAVTGDYNGDGKSDIAVWRPSNGVWYALSSSAPGTYTAVMWGLNDDIPVPGDYDGDGKTDIAVWRPSTGVWYLLPSSNPGTYMATQWGLTEDVPAPGDYDGDGKVDIAVWRPGTGVWYFLPSSAPGSYQAIQWGIATDEPITAFTGIRAQILRLSGIMTMP
jgi:alpha-tubulin suppressor-like RCC1 family protein